MKRKRAYGKNKPDYVLRDVPARGNPNAKFPPGFKRSKLGDAHHTQCACMARSTGQRCRQPAIAGSATCRVHGGHPNGTLAAMRAPRKALARLAVSQRDTMPDRIMQASESWVERGRLLEG